MPSVKELREKYEKEQQESKKNIIFQPMAVPRKSIETVIKTEIDQVRQGDPEVTRYQEHKRGEESIDFNEIVYNTLERFSTLDMLAKMRSENRESCGKLLAQSEAEKKTNLIAELKRKQIKTDECLLRRQNDGITVELVKPVLEPEIKPRPRAQEICYSANAQRIETIINTIFNSEQSLLICDRKSIPMPVILNKEPLTYEGKTMSQDEARHKSSKEKAEVPVVSLSFDISHQKITQSQVRDKGKRILKFDTTE